MSAITGSHCDKGLPLGHALRHWIKCIDQLTQAWQTRKDLPWWYNERADLSILSAAIWKCGGTAIEEFVSAKRYISNATGNLTKPYLGRIDFFFSLIDTHYVVEAKEIWSRIDSRSENPIQRIENRLKDALRDVRKVKSYRDRKLAIVFVKPTLSIRKKQQSKQLIDRWLKLVQTMDVDAMAWYFPAGALKLRWGDLLCPGVIMLVKEQ